MIRVSRPDAGSYHVWPHLLGGNWWWDLDRMGTSGPARLDLVAGDGTDTCYVLEILP